MPVLFMILLFLGISPRLVILVIAMFTNWFERAYETVMWPVLGFFFMPYTTLAYMAASLNSHGNFSVGWILVIVFGVLFDFANNASVSASRSSS